MPPQSPVVFTPSDLLGELSLEDSDFPDEEAVVPDAELPEYSGPSSSRRTGSSSARRERTEHSYSIKSADDHPWLTMKVRSWASSSRSLPVFMEDQSINGSIELDLKKPDSISAVVVSLKGRVEFSHIDKKTFLTLSNVVWDTSKGDPSLPTTPSLHRFHGKLQGHYSWPFSVSLPREIHRDSKHSKTLNLGPVERLPPYFDGKGWRPSIHYELSVDIKRSGPFRVGSTLSTLIAYTPCSTPDPPSSLRQMAYQEHSPIPGPEIDPGGWSVFPAVETRGTVFNNREVLVSCSLALATPIAYTRGSVVPLVLVLTSRDKQALDLLANPQAPVVRMRRKVNSPIGVEDEASANQTPGTEGHKPLSKAGWWHPEEFIDESNAYKRTLCGELHVPPYLTPSFTFGSFELWYALDMYPFDIAGFIPASTERLLRTDIRICTNYPRGPRPKAHLPPGYMSVPRKSNFSRGF